MREFEFNEAGFDELITTAVRPHLRHRAEGVAERAARFAPRGPETDPPHEHLQDSIRLEDGPAELDFYIGSYNDHALIVETGSRPHEIRPRDPAGTLAWRGADGHMHFAKVVHHPGTQPQPYLRPALYYPDDAL